MVGPCSGRKSGGTGVRKSPQWFLRHHFSHLPLLLLSPLLPALLSVLSVILWAAPASRASKEKTKSHNNKDSPVTFPSACLARNFDNFVLPSDLLIYYTYTYSTSASWSSALGAQE